MDKVVGFSLLGLAASLFVWVVVKTVRDSTQPLRYPEVTAKDIYDAWARSVDENWEDDE